MAELHSVTLEWPHGGANNVVVTGTFDHWSRSVKMSKQGSTFKGTVKVPWNEKVAYKFIVDGRWVVNDREPTERDPAGNLNNVYVTPEKPAGVKAEDLVSAKAPAEEGEKAQTQESKSDSATSAVSQDSAPLALSDLKQTVVAAEGTSSALGYLASGVGAAIRSVIGVDPVNTNKIPVETPKTEAPQDVVEIAEKVDPVADAKQDSSLATTVTQDDNTVVTGPTATTDDVPETSQPISNGVPAPLILTSNEDNTLSSPAKAADSENGPSTHVPASEVSISNDSAAVTPPGLPVTSETKSSVPETAPLSTPVSSPPKDATPPPSPPSPPAKEASASTVTPTSSPPASRSTSPALSTPSKAKHLRLPSSESSESPKSDKSPSKSRSRSIRKSLAGLRRVSLKGIFGGKDKEEKEK